MSPLLYLNKDTSYIWNRLLSGCQHLEILETHCKCERRLSNLAAGQALNILKTRAPSHPSACFDFVPKLKKKKKTGPDNLPTRRCHDSFSNIFLIQVFYKQMFYNRTSKIVMAWFVCLSPSSYFFFSFFPLPTPKYGAITNSFAKATVLLVIIIRVFKFSTH